METILLLYHGIIDKPGKQTGDLLVSIRKRAIFRHGQEI